MLKKLMSARTTGNSNREYSVGAIFLRCQFKMVSWKQIKYKNSNLKFRLLALDFYKVIVLSSCGFVNYHLIEILREWSNCEIITSKAFVVAIQGFINSYWTLLRAVFIFWLFTKCSYTLIISYIRDRRIQSMGKRIGCGEIR